MFEAGAEELWREKKTERNGPILFYFIIIYELIIPQIN